jgi:hypothetical protein
MGLLKQKDAVYNAVKSVITFEDGDKVELTKEQKYTVVAILVEGFNAGDIELGSPQENIKKYSDGLLNNWLRKDKRMNGGDKYVAKNPGSRAGAADPMIKNLRLLKQRAGLTPEDMAQVEAAIEARLAEIKPKKETVIDASVLPAELQDLVK